MHAWQATCLAEVVVGQHSETLGSALSIFLELQVKEEDTHLSITAIGPYTQSALRAFLDGAKAEAEKRGARRVLLDLSQVSGAVSVVDMLVLAEHFMRIWCRSTKTAMVSWEGGIDTFFENVAYNRGYLAAVVPNRQAGIEWLKT